MATVYLARDLRHNRNVALKLLTPELGAVLGGERFLAEIQVTANLQHPNLLPLFDSGEAAGLLYYVMPYVEGESLRARLQREKQLPVDEAVSIATALAGALDYAHARGVIHRDLKPENILMQSGQPVIADFGIALAVSNAGGARVTQTGISLGTPQYMSPEQATGDRAIDGRTDIYSLGVILYEMLTGDAPYLGGTAQAVIAKLLTEKPRSARASRASIPEHVEQAIERALEKLPADRFATAREFADAVQGRFLPTTARSAPQATPASRAYQLRRRVVLGTYMVSALIAMLWGGYLIGRRGDASTGVVRLNISVPQDMAFANIYAGPPIAISPDGMTIVYTARTAKGPQLAIRRLDELKPRVLAGTVAGIYPFFANNGAEVVFSDGAQYFRVALDGSPPSEASPTQAGAGNGATALPDGGFIAAFSAGLLQARAFGDSLTPLTKADSAQGDYNHRFPVVVDKNTVLFTSVGTKSRRIGIASLKGGPSTVLDLPGVAPLGMVDNYLVYVQSDGTFDGIVSAVKVDLAGRKLLGQPVALERGVSVHGNGSVEAALSANGTLVYSSGSTTSRMMSVDLRGVSQPLFGEVARLASPRYSPDGRRIVVNRTDQSSDTWIYDIGSKVPTRLTSDGLTNDRPEWSADGRRVAYRSALGSFWWQRADGTDKPELMVRTAARRPGDFSTAGTVAEVAMLPDGKRLIARIPHLGTGMDLMMVTLGDTLSAKPFVATRFNEYMPTVSRDGKWLAFISAEAGPLDVYVRSIDGAATRFPVSSGGGMEPRWAPDGKHLYYRANRTIMSATISTTPSFTVIATDTLFSDIYATDPFHTNWDISPDGTRFVMLQPVDNSQQAVVVLNFAKEVRDKMAAAKK
jgi:hypothetical protein